jgi:hypothetical protein
VADRAALTVLPLGRIYGEVKSAAKMGRVTTREELRSDYTVTASPAWRKRFGNGEERSYDGTTLP